MYHTRSQRRYIFSSEDETMGKQSESEDDDSEDTPKMRHTTRRRLPKSSSEDESMGKQSESEDVDSEKQSKHPSSSTLSDHTWSNYCSAQRLPRRILGTVSDHGLPPFYLHPRRLVSDCHLLPFYLHPEG
ncbi:hypothetical protein BT96DRAFT_239051 [Gymnopus androsaceus JB14]|uniref:Uncharacterized protein n=1 Tax=Gymnopus androsaceus JB14 TaxID=1447944 RepID=A0A6A4IJM2_9AGAR|nr:hypothetical protein BT96DRAFT_239051 [Gymnopus androsaceus JB14]